MALFHTTVVDNQIKALDSIGTASGAVATFDTDRGNRRLADWTLDNSATTITICGKNLFDESQIINASGWSESGGVYTGSVAQLYLYANNGFPKQPKFKANTQYTLSVYINATNAVSRFRIYYTDSTYSDLAIASTMVGTTQTHLTAPNNTVDKITFTYNAGGDLSMSNIQFEENTTPTAYESFNGNTYAIADIENLKTLNGINNIYTDVGNISVDYILSVGKAIS